MNLRKKCGFPAHMSLWLLIGLIAPAFVNPVLAVNQFLEDGIKQYNAGNYSEAIGLLGAAEHTEFNDAILHYYMAAALVRTNQKEEAIREYNIALSLQPKGQLADYCRRALQSLCGTPAVVEPASPKVSAALVSKLIQNQNSSTQKDTRWRSENLTALEKERKEKIHQLEAEAEKEINAVHEQVAQDKESFRLSTPTFYRGAFGVIEPNPAYQAGMGRIEDDAVCKVNDINLRLKKQVEDINRVFEQRESTFKTASVEQTDDTLIHPAEIRGGGQAIPTVPSVNTPLGWLPLVNIQDNRRRIARTIYVRMASDGTWETDGQGRRLWTEELVKNAELRSAWQTWQRDVANEILPKVRAMVDFKTTAAVDLVISRNGEIYKSRAYDGADGPDGSGVDSEGTKNLLDALKSVGMPAFPPSSRLYYARVLVFVTYRAEQWWRTQI